MNTRPHQYMYTLTSPQKSADVVYLYYLHIVIFQVVSVSRTPGHTKHFQTIYLTPTVKLCDSPGLVFPSLVSKSMQVS